MEADGLAELRNSVERNQCLIDCLLARRTQDERRCDLYQRIEHADDARRTQLESATAALHKELLSTLERVYVLEQQSERSRQAVRPSALRRTKLSDKKVDVAHQLRTSVCETQRFNESLRAEAARQASYCEVLRRTLLEKQAHCSVLQDSIADESTRSTRIASSPRVAPTTSSLLHTSNLSDGSEEAKSFAEALFMDTTQFYQRAFAAARDALVEYIALQEELRGRLQRAPPHVFMGTSFEVSLLNSVQFFANTYTQLRRREHERYQEVSRTLTRLLRERKEDEIPFS